MRALSLQSWVRQNSVLIIIAVLGLSLLIGSFLAAFLTKSSRVYSTSSSFDLYTLPPLTSRSIPFQIDKDASVKIELWSNSSVLLEVRLDGKTFMPYRWSNSTVNVHLRLLVPGSWDFFITNTNSSLRCRYSLSYVIDEETLLVEHPYMPLSLPFFAAGAVTLTLGVPVSYTKREWINKHKRAIIANIIIISLALFVVFGTQYALGIFLNTKAPLAYVETGSMEPTIHIGDLEIIQGVDPSTIKVNDIIAFDKTCQHVGDSIFDTLSPPISHRVIEVFTLGDHRYFKTKGDYNQSPDPWLVPQEGMVGKVSLVLPKLGYLMAILSRIEVKAVILVVLGGAYLWMPTFKSKGKKSTAKNVSAPKPKEAISWKGTRDSIRKTMDKASRVLSEIEMSIFAYEEQLKKILGSTAKKLEMTREDTQTYVAKVESKIKPTTTALNLVDDLTKAMVSLEGMPNQLTDINKKFGKVSRKLKSRLRSERGAVKLPNLKELKSIEMDLLKINSQLDVTFKAINTDLQKLQKIAKTTKDESEDSKRMAENSLKIVTKTIDSINENKLQGLQRSQTTIEKQTKDQEEAVKEIIQEMLETLDLIEKAQFIITERQEDLEKHKDSISSIALNTRTLLYSLRDSSGSFTKGDILGEANRDFGVLQGKFNETIEAENEDIASIDMCFNSFTYANNCYLKEFESINQSKNKLIQDITTNLANIRSSLVELKKASTESGKATEIAKSCEAKIDAVQDMIDKLTSALSASASNLTKTIKPINEKNSSTLKKLVNNWKTKQNEFNKNTQTLEMHRKELDKELKKHTQAIEDYRGSIKKNFENLTYEIKHQQKALNLLAKDTEKFKLRHRRLEALERAVESRISRLGSVAFSRDLIYGFGVLFMAAAVAMPSITRGWDITNWSILSIGLFLTLTSIGISCAEALRIYNNRFAALHTFLIYTSFSVFVFYMAYLISLLFFPWYSLLLLYVNIGGLLNTLIFALVWKLKIIPKIELIILTVLLLISYGLVLTPFFLWFGKDPVTLGIVGLAVTASVATMFIRRYYKKRKVK